MEARKYKSDVSNRNPWKEPTSSTKKPAPTVPTIAANVPAVFEIPKTRNEVVLITYHPNYNVQRLYFLDFLSDSEANHILHI